MSKYENFGDVDFMEHYGLWIAEDTEVSHPCYYIVRLDKLEDSEESKYQVIDGYVDLSDGWINWSRVYEEYDIDDNSDIYERIVDLISCYGIIEFGGYPQNLSSTLEAIEYLESYDIDVPTSSTDYKEDIEYHVLSMLDEVVMAIAEFSLDDEEEAKIKAELRDEFDNLPTPIELCEKYKYELDDIKYYLEETYGVRFY